MIRLFIDGVEARLKECSSVMPRYNIAMLRDVDGWRSGVDIEVEIASSSEIDALLCYSADMHRSESFNAESHTARVELYGITVFEGIATLSSTTSDNGVLSYRLRLRQGGALWARSAALTTIRESGVDEVRDVSLGVIEQSWSDDGAITFLPLQQDSYPKPTPSSLYGVERMMSPSDYHPFLSIRKIVDSIAQSGGCTLRSNFMDSDLFRHLLMSGAYPRVDVEVAERDMGFKAYRTYSSSAVAGQSGKLNLCEPRSSINLGSVVDSVDPMAQDEGGNRLSDAYTNDGCLSFVNNEPIFTPTRDVAIAFEYHLRYTTDCRMLSSKRLQGFDRIHLGNGCDVEMVMRNPYIDRRNTLLPNMQYKLMVFDHIEGSTYRLSNIGDGLTNNSRVTTPSELSVTTTQLFVRRSSADKYTLYSGDWALYDGHVESTFSRDFEVVVRSPLERVTPTSPKRFNDIYFSGACEGQQLTLHSGCSVKAIFGGGVGYGDRLTFGDVSHHDISQATLLYALIQMFNLCVYYHTPTRRLFIEPYDDFFNGAVVDWQERQVDGVWHYDEGIAECFEHTKLGYASGDGVALRVEGAEDSYEWQYHTSGYGSKMGTESILNPLFSPVVSLTEATTSAPSAEILTVGNRDIIAESSYIAPRIVVYHGLSELPEGEHWQAIETPTKYPFASFHSPSADVTLSFGDRDGLVGLHRYYDRELDERAERGRLRCTIALRPDEYIDLLDPSSKGATIRSRFRLRTEYGSSLFILESIDNYDSDSLCATCTFRRTLND
jgi:hypothetical protein